MDKAALMCCVMSIMQGGKMQTHPRQNILCLMLIVMLMLTGLVQPARMQRNVDWENGCNPAIVALIEPTEGAFDYSAACESYMTCAINSAYMSVCQLQALHTLLAVCPADDTHCHQGAV